MPSLKITPVPFRSSNLAIPPSPFSPRSPLTPLPQPKKPRYNARLSCIGAEPPKAPAPLLWMWQCHQCRQQYPLGATRRCLEDGHMFCAGSSVVRSRKNRNQKIVKKHRACASEFDYSAWKALGDWRRSCMVPPTPSSTHAKDCWRNCDYPSECRWSNKVAQKVEQFSPTILDSPPNNKVIVELEGTPVDLKKQQQQQIPATTFDVLLSAINHPSVALQSFLGSPTRKKSTIKRKSPLKLHTVIEEDEEGDLTMANSAEAIPSPLTKCAAEQVAQLSADLSVPPPQASVQRKSCFEDFEFGFGDDDIILTTKC